MNKIFLLPLSLLDVILACLRAILDAVFGSQPTTETSAQHLQNHVRRISVVEQKAAEITRAAQSLEQEHERYIRKFQTYFFKIEMIRLMAYDRVQLFVSDVAGGAHHWFAEIDESEHVIFNESMPDSLLLAILKTDSPSSTLSELMRLIQAEVDIQMPQLHGINLQRLLAIPALEDISMSQQMEFAK